MYGPDVPSHSKIRKYGNTCKILICPNIKPVMKNWNYFCSLSIRAHSIKTNLRYHLCLSSVHEILLSLACNHVSSIHDTSINNSWTISWKRPCCNLLCIFSSQTDLHFFSQAVAESMAVIVGRSRGRHPRQLLLDPQYSPCTVHPQSANTAQ